MAPATAPAPAENLSADLDVVKKSKGPVMTVIDEFYKVGPGPSSSHTIGPMRITYDFYQRCTKLPAGPARQSDRHEGASVRQPQRHRQGPRHRASRSGRRHRQRTGHRRAASSSTSLRTNPDQSFPVKLGDKTFNVSLKDIIYDAQRATSRTRTR